ncbi:hypothetical protein Hanom_Chr09g00766281 [Helianthus anomalus]
MNLGWPFSYINRLVHSFKANHFDLKIDELVNTDHIVINVESLSPTSLRALLNLDQDLVSVKYLRKDDSTSRLIPEFLLLCQKTLILCNSYEESLRLFHDSPQTATPFGLDTFDVGYDEFCHNQLDFLSKDEIEKIKLQRDAKYYKYSRHFSTGFFCLIFITIYLSTLVAAAMEAAPLVKAVIAGLPTVTVGSWVNGKFKKKEEDIKNT